MQKVVQLLRLSRFIEQEVSSLIFRSLLIITLVIGFTFRASSQDLVTKKISLNIKAASLKEALQEVQKQSSIRILFGEYINKYAAAKVSINEKNISVKDAIELILKNTGLRYVQMDKSIMIDEKPAPKSPNAAAGQGPGTIKGRIVEFETSQPLPGASVYILELKKGITSDNSGYYKFSNIPAGKYTLQVSYVSFTTEKITVETKDGKEETYNVKMRGSNSLNEVVVSSVRKSRAPVAHTTEKQVIEEIKNSQSVVSGISSEQISKSADRNAAEVVRKIAGVTIRDDKFIIIRGMNERYNLTYLNNNIAPSTELYSRAFSLDLIPSRIIDRILVYKSPAPDLLGDMTGGAVKIFTKDAKNVKHFDIEFQSGYRENTTFNSNFLTYQGGKFDFLGFDDGTRKLPSSVPGYGDFTKANISQKEYAKSFSNILTYGKKTASPLMQLTANYYNSFKVGGKNLSVLSSLSYKNDPQHLDVDRTQGNLTYQNDIPSAGTMLSKMSNESQNNETAQLSLLQNFTYSLRDSSKLYFKNFLLQQGQSSTILRNTKTNQGFSDGTWHGNKDNSGDYTNLELRDILLSYSQRFLYSGNIGGSHYLGKGGKQNLEWNTGYTYSKLDIPDQRAIHLQNNIQNDGRFQLGGDHELNWVPVFRGEDNLIPNNNIDLGMISRVWIRNTEKVYNGSADYTYKFKPWITLKAGTYQQWKERIVFRRAYTVNEGDLNSSGYPNSATPTIGAFAPDMDYNIVFWHQQDLGKVWSPEYLRDNNTGLKVFDRTSGSDAYTATEQNNSGYVAASLLPFNGKLDIYGGLRVEYNRQKVAGAVVKGGGNPGDIGIGNVPVMADLKSTEFLPSLNIGYRPNQDLVFRAAYGKTVNRPEFRELSPYSELDYVNNQVVRGNSDLVFATVNNYDLRMEWYPKANAKGESISLGGFYKQIKNPIERIIFKELYFPGAATITFMNADKAVVRGVELDIRKNLDFVPLKFFRDLSIIANGSFIYSHATRQKITTDRADIDAQVDRQLQGQAPYSVNVGLYYENAGSGTKIAIIGNQVGPRIYAASVGQPAKFDAATNTHDPGDQGSLIELTRKQLDFSLTQRVIKSLQAKLSIQNLLNSPIQVAEDANFTYKYERATISNTVPLNPGGQIGGKVAGDLLASDYKPGRFFLLTFTYGF